MKPSSKSVARRSRADDRNATRSTFLVYVGTYNKAKGKGIHAYRFDAATGQLTSLGLATEAVNPTFVTVDARNRFLYATKEVERHEGKQSGALKAFAIDRRTGKLRFLNETITNGTVPCYVALDKSGQSALVPNYGSGSVVVIRVQKDGRLGKSTSFHQRVGSGVNPERQEGPHAHWINVSPDNHYALSSDLGVDKVFVYRFDEKKGALELNTPPYAEVSAGSGPRHIAFSPNGRFVYLINELKSTITAFSYRAERGALSKLQTISTLPRGYKGHSDCAEIAVSPSGKFVYGSNRGHDSIAVFAVNPRKGTLTAVERVSTQGKTPRHFAIDPTGSYLIVGNQDSNSLVVFRVDRKTGRLTPTGHAHHVTSPACVRFANFA
jgi:6-phosphogluconolactonase